MLPWRHFWACVSISVNFLYFYLKSLFFRAGAKTTFRLKQTHSWRPLRRLTMTSWLSLLPTTWSWRRARSLGGRPGYWNRGSYIHLTIPNTRIYFTISTLSIIIPDCGGITGGLTSIQNTGLGTPITLWIPNGKFCVHQQMWRHASTNDLTSLFFCVLCLQCSSEGKCFHFVWGERGCTS